MPIYAVFYKGGVTDTCIGGIMSEIGPVTLSNKTTYCTTEAEAKQLLLEFVAEQAARHGGGSQDDGGAQDVEDEYAPSDDYEVARLPFEGAVMDGFVWSAMLRVEEEMYCGVFSTEAQALERLRNMFELMDEEEPCDHVVLVEEDKDVKCPSPCIFRGRVERHAVR